MISLLFAVSAKGGGVPWAGLGLGFLGAGEFSLKVLEVVSLLLDKGQEALVGVCAVRKPYNLVLNNTTLATTNESLVALVKKQTNDLKNLERELARLKKPQSPSQPKEPPHPLR